MEELLGDTTTAGCEEEEETAEMPPGAGGALEVVAVVSVFWRADPEDASW